MTLVYEQLIYTNNHEMILESKGTHYSMQI